jgi:hypothetical protein
MENTKPVETYEEVKFEDKTCRVCNKNLRAKRLGRISSHGWVTYCDERNRRWLGSMCPDCSNEHRKTLQRRRRVVRQPKACMHCNTMFKPDRKNAEFCKPECAIKYHSLKRTTDKRKLEKGLKGLLNLAKAATGSPVTLEDIEKLKTLLLDEKTLKGLNELLLTKGETDGTTKS